MPSSYTVHRGDTLSEIAARYYGSAARYPSLWWINKGKVRDPNAIEVGEVLKLSHWHPQTAWLAVAAKKADPPVVRRSVRNLHHYAAVSSGGGGGGHHDRWDGHHYPGGCGDGDGDGLGDMPCSMLHHGGGTVVYRHSGRSYRAARSYRSSGGYSGSISAGSGPGGSFGACVVARESGGNSQVMNSSGHYGLYQFSASTWAAYGGSSATFGHASVAEQQRVFSNALARGGQSNWSPYDGC